VRFEGFFEFKTAVVGANRKFGDGSGGGGSLGSVQDIMLFHKMQK
jgi:hypothetical protein